MSDYLTAEQYEYAKKTGDWESGKVLTHGQALNDNQQIVLEYLKSKVTEDKVNPVNAIFILGHLWGYRRFGIEEEIKVADAYDELDSRQQAQAIEVFSKWAQKQEEAE